jgi:hypothetical protein
MFLLRTSEDIFVQNDMTDSGVAADSLWRAYQVTVTWSSPYLEVNVVLHLTNS